MPAPAILRLLQGFQQRGFVDDRPARGVDEIGRRLHPREIGAPTSPRERSLSTIWMVMMSAVANSSSLVA